MLGKSTMLVRHKENITGCDYIVGDIHGQWRLLQDALDRVNFQPTRDRVFCVGDLIDRGSASVDCLSLVFEPWFFSVLGNHEVLAKDALDAGGGQLWDLWFANGGSWVLGENPREVKRILSDALRYLPYAREIPAAGKRLGIVHAEPPRDWQRLQWQGQVDTTALVWSRTRFKQQDQSHVEGIDAVAVGHTTVAEPGWLGNVRYLDTGAFHTGTLTLVPINEILGAIPLE